LGDSGLARALDVIILDNPHGYLVEISSCFYYLSNFSSKADSHHDGGAGPTQGKTSSVSIEDLWPKIDSLRKAGHEGIFTTAPCSCLEALTSQPPLGARGVEKKNK
jgi:hypothetical protein